MQVTIFGGYILHITDSGRRLESDVYNSHGHFVKHSDSAIIVGSGEWTLVMLVYSQTSVTLLGNGMASFSGSQRNNMLRDDLFHAQRLGVGTAVMDLNHVRVMPATKSSPTTPGRALRSISQLLSAQWYSRRLIRVHSILLYLSMVLETGLKGTVVN
jgi:hypothetical protein